MIGERWSKSPVRFEYNSPFLHKFLEFTVEGEILTVRSGKIGTVGWTYSKKFVSSQIASWVAGRLVCARLATGYKPSVSSRSLIAESETLNSSAAICSLNSGEGDIILSGDTLSDICAWLTACIKYGMPSSRFSELWYRFLESDGELFCGAFGWMPENNHPWWLDLSELYEEAQQNNGDKFMWVYTHCDGFSEIVALRGDPGVRSIFTCVYGEDYFKNDKLDKLPDELGPGAAIEHLSDYDAVLRNGKIVNLGIYNF